MEKFEPNKNKIYLLNQKNEIFEDKEDNPGEEIYNKESLYTEEIFETKDEETPEEYIDRVLTNFIDVNIKSNSDSELDFMVSRKIKINTPTYNPLLKTFFDDEGNSEKFKKVLDSLEKNNDIKFSEEKNAEVLYKLKDTLSNAYRVSPIFDENKISFYETTNQSRKFLKHGIAYDSYSYTSMVFNLPDSFSKTKKGKEYINNIIKDKNIALLGGGHSLSDLTFSNNFKPKKIFNFDPYLRSESIYRNINKNYESIPMSASDKILEFNFENKNFPKMDEIWATYSVPYYLNTKEEIIQFMNNAVSMLEEGGNLRISPISFQSFDDGIADYRTRVDTFMENIKNIIKDECYNVSVFNETLKIHKIKK